MRDRLAWHRDLARQCAEEWGLPEADVHAAAKTAHTALLAEVTDVDNSRRVVGLAMVRAIECLNAAGQYRDMASVADSYGKFTGAGAATKHDMTVTGLGGGMSAKEQADIARQIAESLARRAAEEDPSGG